MHGLRTACRTTAYRGRSPSAKYVAPRVQLARQPGYALDRDALLLRKARGVGEILAWAPASRASSYRRQPSVWLENRI